MYREAKRGHRPREKKEPVQRKLQHCELTLLKEKGRTGSVHANIFMESWK